MSAPLSHVKELLRLAEANTLNCQSVLPAALAAGLRPADLLDAVSVEVATRYKNGVIPFATADGAMNTIWAVACDPEFLSSNDRVIPAITERVFLAFDEGEYVHPGDDEDLDPVVKYTDVQVDEILSSIEPRPLSDA